MKVFLVFGGWDDYNECSQVIHICSSGELAEEKMQKIIEKKGWEKDIIEETTLGYKVGNYYLDVVTKEMDE